MMTDREGDFLTPPDEEDIRRIFKELHQPNPARRNLACAFGFHSWTRWWVRQKGKLMRGSDPVGSYMMLMRVCVGCHKVAAKRLEY